MYVQDDPRAANGSVLRATVTGNTVIDASGLGVFVQGPNAAATVINNTASIIDNQVGIQVDGGRALVENNNLSGNIVAGILATNGAIVDAGDCSGGDVTGLGTGSGLNGSSAGENNLSGYGFDNAAPWAVEDLNSSAQPVCWRSWTTTARAWVRTLTNSSTTSPTTAASRRLYSARPDPWI